MPQLVLPLYSAECKLINSHIGFEKIGGRIYYYLIIVFFSSYQGK